MTTLAVIAGAGGLPAALAQEVATHGVAPLVCAPQGVAPVGLTVDYPFRFERLAPFLRSLGDKGITQVVLAGAINRPVLDPALFDPETAGMLPGIMAAMQTGDDAVMRWVIGLIEGFDLQVIGVADVAPGLLAPDGVLSDRAPTEAEQADATRGRAILDHLAPVDVGQGCAVASGLCLGVEAIFGTDAILADVARNRPSRTPHKGGVFVKRCKAGQEMRADLPTIGPATIAAAQAAGLTAVCLHAGHVVVLDRAAVVAAADAAGMALWATL